MTSLVLRIRKRYFDAIVSGEKRVEFRKDSEFWRKRIIGKEKLDTAVFICGKRVHRRKITSIHCMKTPSWFSEQGKEDVNTPMCFAINLGGARYIGHCGMILQKPKCLITSCGRTQKQCQYSSVKGDKTK